MKIVDATKWVKEHGKHGLFDVAADDKGEHLRITCTKCGDVIEVSKEEENRTNED